MADPPQKDSSSAPRKRWSKRPKEWLHRSKDWMKDTFKIGSSSAPTTRPQSRIEFAASTANVVLGQSPSNQQGHLSLASPAPLRPARSFQDPASYDTASVSNAQTILAPALAQASHDSSAAPIPFASAAIQNQVPNNDSTFRSALTPSAASPPLGSDGVSSRPANEPSPAPSGVKNVLKRSWDFTRTLLKHLPELVDGNPVKVALVLAKVVSEIDSTVRDNMDKTEQHIALVVAQLKILGDDRVTRWGSDGPEMPWLEGFKRTLSDELGKLCQLKKEGILEKIASHEDERSQISAIFERINQARIQFELSTNLRVYKAVARIEQAIMRTLPDKLQPSHMADHRYHIGGKVRETLRREACTPGTRIRTLRSIVDWAKLAGSEDIFWLFGPAGAGKTTIAYTIARFFEAAGEADGTVTLGGNFLCSRQFEETRSEARIIRTLAYQLARKCDGFANALNQLKNFDSIHQDVGTQMRDFLVTPWQQHLSTSDRLSSDAQQYLFLVDAVDELEDDGGPAFLCDLIEAVNANHLHGIKFFITSRPHPKIVDLVELSERKQLVRLQDVEEEEVKRDVETYLEASLPNFKGLPEMGHIKDYAGSLFICAATIVRALTLGSLQIEDQKRILHKFVSAKLKNTTNFLDDLYGGILSEAFGPFERDEDLLADKLAILHALLCTMERTSTSVVAQLLAPGPSPLSPNAADDVLTRLYAVLYLDERNIVLSYHKSFSDYMFDKNRSGRFACNQTSQHHLLAQHCFGVMSSLKFNIANIPSSFLLDSENTDWETQVVQSIPPGLSYASRNWCQHLLTTPCNLSNPFLSTLSKFLQLKVLFWIEAMNLLKCPGQCDPDLQQVSRWVGKNNPALAQQLMEAASYALYFSGSPASASTPHLYLSTLATWPPDHGLAHTWRSHFPRIPNFRSFNSESGSALMQISVPGTPYGLAMQADGTQLICGLTDHSVRIYKASTGQELKVLTGHTKEVLSVAISITNTHIVSGSMDNSIRIWDALTGKELKTLEGHTDGVWSVAISADGTQIVSGSEDKSIWIWDVSTGEQVEVLEGHTGSVLSVAISVDRTCIVSGSADCSVRIWDMPTGRELKTLEGHEDAVWSVAISADGTHVVSGSADNSVWIWEASTGKQLKVLEGHTGWVNSVVFSPDMAHIISGSADQTVRIWDLGTGEVLKVLKGHTSWVRSVAISADGTRIASGSGDRSVRVWDAFGKGVEVTESHTNQAVSSPADGMAIASGSSNTSTSAPVPDDLTGQKLEAPEGHMGPVGSVAISVDGTHIISAGQDNSIRIWDASTGKQLQVLEGHSAPVRSVAASADGTCIVSGSWDKLVRVWDGLTGQELKVLQGHTDKVYAVAISMDVTHIVSGSADCSIRVWDASTGEELKILGGHRAAVMAVTISADGTHIISGSADESVQVWDTSTGIQLKVLEGHTHQVNSVAISPDMAHIISGSQDSSIRIWDMSTGKELKVLEGHAAPVWSAAISADGTHIVSGSEDRSICVWDMATGAELAVLEGHTDDVLSVAISADGNQIISGSVDRSVRLWDINSTPKSTNNAGRRLQGGWILLPNRDDRLMFVPPHLGFPSPHLIRIFPSPEYPPPTVDFEQAALGTNWHECYLPK